MKTQTTRYEDRPETGVPCNEPREAKENRQPREARRGMGQTVPDPRGLLVPSCKGSGLQDWEGVHFSCVSHGIFSALLCQSKERNQ